MNIHPSYLWDDDAQSIVMDFRMTLVRLKICKLRDTAGNWSDFNAKYFAYKRGPFSLKLFMF
jgi:hypothetical protein